LFAAGFELDLALVAGNPAIAYQDPVALNSRMACSSTADGSGPWTVTIIDPQTNVGGYPCPSVATVGGQGGFACFGGATLSLKYSYVNMATPAGIQVEQPAGIRLISGTAVDFGTSTLGVAAAPLTFTVRNTGVAALTVSGLTKTGSHVADFSLSSAAGFVLAPGATHAFNVTFTPSAVGTRTATVNLLSSDAVLPTYQIPVSGVGRAQSRIETWRQLWFGSPANAGNGADGADPDHDGSNNLAEFALATTPTVSGAAGASFVVSGGLMEYTYTRSKDAVMSGVRFAPWWSETFDSFDWQDYEITEQVLAETSTTQTVKVTVPVGTNGRRFLRIDLSMP
jgi:hypothetical protein